MPKLKTSRSAAKRFRVTKHGKVLKKHACVSHLLTKKSRNRKRKLRRSSALSSVEQKMIRTILPYA
jgi:large subunit ribosomal protein L35